MAVHHACDERDFEAAEELLGTLERIVTRPGQNANRREETNRLVMAYERLWMMRHPEVRD